MNESTAPALAVSAATSQDMLTEILRDGAQRLLGQAIEAEVESWIESHKHLVGDDGHRQVVGNGHLPTRTILTGVGPVQVTRRRVHDRRIVGENDDGQAIDSSGRPIERFASKILPPYLRKTKSIEELIPWLYLKGISTGDFTEALQALLGPSATGLSATTVDPPDHDVAEGLRRLEHAIAGEQAIRVRLGERRALQHSFGRGSTVYSGAHDESQRRIAVWAAPGRSQRDCVAWSTSS